jgi:hypothetical protein
MIVGAKTSDYSTATSQVIVPQGDPVNSRAVPNIPPTPRKPIRNQTIGQKTRGFRLVHRLNLSLICVMRCVAHRNAKPFMGGQGLARRGPRREWWTPTEELSSETGSRFV